MPPNNLQDFQAEIILAYLRSVATAGRSVSGNGDAARGKALFEGKGDCESCHRVNGNGSRVGPDLSEIGALRRTGGTRAVVARPECRESFRRIATIAWSRETARPSPAGFSMQDTFTVQILDSKERLVSLPRSNLRESGFH